MDAGTPSGWVTRWTHLIAPGASVLDVASGSGRHARWLAARGHAVLAVDRDADALASMSALPDIATLCADLEGAPWPLAGGRTFGAVVVTRYLHRPLFTHLIHALAPGGALIYETFAAGNQTVGKPSNPAFLLEPGELLEAVRGRLRVIAYEDGFVDAPHPAFVQRICAVLVPEPAKAGAIEDTTGNTPSGWPRYELTG
ncbi:class I SAM-dependent methyltransferase [Caballeronia sp. LZ001]|uniref:class I SAM-dependent methyltransferase n=1 Tax=Caballeronia sp. LZ001 TaxID=3038553 RepID=UPI00285695D5|nr:class I SAM-dependent methyltransferase [Caballeronia sp. LZ001]MDR5804562.1 class I SAM-dependent methyltransferase [Caballeronia sp. LZ001]